MNGFLRRQSSRFIFRRSSRQHDIDWTEKAGPSAGSQRVTAAGKQVYTDAGMLALDIGFCGEAQTGGKRVSLHTAARGLRCRDCFATTARRVTRHACWLA